MRHGREKSDSAVVAWKPTNKVGQSTPEPAGPYVRLRHSDEDASTSVVAPRRAVVGLEGLDHDLVEKNHKAGVGGHA
jgi:hypothetical protein